MPSKLPIRDRSLIKEQSANWLRVRAESFAC